MQQSTRWTSLKTLSALLLPVFLLGIVIAIPNILPFGFRGGFVTEELAIERIRFAPDEILVDVRNVGPIDATIETVFVNDAIWDFEASPSRSVARFATAHVSIRHSWVYGEPYTITFLSSPSNIRFSRSVQFATLTPTPSIGNAVTLAQAGVFVGVVPVFLGLLWFPFLRRVGSRWMDYLLGFTVGLLVFLAIDSIAEALDVGGQLPNALGGVGLILAGLAGTFLGLASVNLRASSLKKEKDKSLLITIGYLVALGIGLHNLGEGLAIGSAFALGSIALGARLVLGFTIHNTTEGLAIASPIVRTHPSVYQLGTMGLLAGVPTIFGAWIGGFVQQDFWSVLFLSVGAGAILEVVYEIGRQVKGGLQSAYGYGGIVTGLVVMYLTALLVAA